MSLLLAQAVLFGAAFRLAPASAEVEGLAQQYLAIRIRGAPATIALYALTGWLVGLERTRGVLVLQLWQNGLNIGLDLWFVLGLGWALAGPWLGRAGGGGGDADCRMDRAGTGVVAGAGCVCGLAGVVGAAGGPGGTATDVPGQPGYHGANGVVAVVLHHLRVSGGPVR